MLECSEQVVEDGWCIIGHQSIRTFYGIISLGDGEQRKYLGTRNLGDVHCVPGTSTLLELQSTPGTATGYSVSGRKSAAQQIAHWSLPPLPRHLVQEAYTNRHAGAHRTLAAFLRKSWMNDDEQRSSL
jgi:hypothetical protein